MRPRGSPLRRLRGLQTYHSLRSFVVAPELLSLSQRGGLVFCIQSRVNPEDSGAIREPWQPVCPYFLQSLPGWSMLGRDPPGCPRPALSPAGVSASRLRALRRPTGAGAGPLVGHSLLPACLPPSALSQSDCCGTETTSEL